MKQTIIFPNVGLKPEKRGSFKRRRSLKKVAAFGRRMIAAALFLFLTADACPLRAESSESASPGIGGNPDLPQALAGELPPAMKGSFEDVRILLTDLAAAQACEQLQGRFFSLTESEGAWSENMEAPGVGNLRIRECAAAKSGPKELRLHLSGDGWRWVSRESSKLGASFKVEEILKFGFSVSTRGTLDLAYEKNRHILTLWLVPLEPMEIEFSLTGEVDVQKETLWAALMGQAASLFGDSPEERAQETIHDTFLHKFRQKVEHGFTAIVDLCTRERYVKFGSFPAGTLPQNLSKQKNGFLPPGSLLISGPHKTDHPFTAEISHLEGGGLEARIFCQKAAETLAASYAEDMPIAEYAAGPALAQAEILPGENAELKIDTTAGCETALVLTPLEGSSPAVFSYSIRQEKKDKSFVLCPGRT